MINFQDYLKTGGIQPPKPQTLDISQAVKSGGLTPQPASKPAPKPNLFQSIGTTLSNGIKAVGHAIGNQPLIGGPNIGPNVGPSFNPAPNLKVKDVINNFVAPQSVPGQIIRGNFDKVAPAFKQTLKTGADEQKQIISFTRKALKGQNPTPEEKLAVKNMVGAAIGSINFGHFNEPYKPGDIKTLENYKKELLGSVNRTDPKLSRLDELQHYADQGNQGAKDILDQINTIDNHIARAKLAKGGNDISSQVQQAQQHDPVFKQNVDNVASNLGMKVEHGPVKSVDRAVQKLSEGPVRDLNRSTIMVNNPADTQKVIDEIGKTNEITRVKPAGNSQYKSTIVNIKTPAGEGEIQITTPEMYAAKMQQGGHELYQQVRNKIGDWRAAREKMNQLYAEADAAAAARLKSSSVIGSPSVSALSGENKPPLAVTPNTSSVLGSKSTLTGTSSTMKNMGNFSDINKPPINPSVTENGGVVNGIPKEQQLPQAGNISQHTPSQTNLPSGSPPEAPQLSSSSNVPPEGDPVKKVIQAIKDAKPIRGQQQKLYSQELSKRTAEIIQAGKVGGEAGYAAQLKALKGELPKATYEGIGSQVSQGERDALFNMIEGSKLTPLEKIHAKNGLNQIIGKTTGGVPQTSQLKLLNEVFGSDLTNAVISKTSLGEKLFQGTSNIVNVPRALMASTDFSAGLRQGGFLLPSYPKQWASAFVDQFKSAVSQKHFDNLISEIQSRPTYPSMREGNLALTGPSSKLTAHEEQFLSNLAEKLPIIGPIVKASDRAYSGFLNKFRADVFDSIFKSGADLGKGEDQAFAKSVASFVNNATGRGELSNIPFIGKALEQSAPLLNGAFFSPRLMASRLNLMNPKYYVNLDPTVRKQAVKSLVSFAATGMTILGLAKLAGADVGADPRSADFGKIKVGNTRYDIWGGFQQYARLSAQLITGQSVNSTTGKVYQLGQGYKPTTRLDILNRFAETKSAPVLSFAISLLRGQDQLGQPIDLKSEVAKRFIPLVIQDANEVLKGQGLLKGAIMETPGVFGVGSQTYGAGQTKTPTRSSGRTNSVRRPHRVGTVIH